MIETLKFIVVEDKEEDLKTVQYQLADAGFNPDNKLGTCSTYTEAKTLIEEHAHELNVVFLDLNLPINEQDGQPEKRHGANILKLIHSDLNRRSNIGIRVIIVSGEDLDDGVQDDLFKERYKGTLVGIVQKANLPIMLKANIRRLKKDPLRNRMCRCNLDVIDFYDIIFDPGQPIKERLEAARSLAIRIVQNEVDHSNQRIDSCIGYADNLNGLIKDHIESRFHPEGNIRRIKASKIISTDGWGAFLWRGIMVQHLYALNSYRNLFVHIHEQPFRCTGQDTDKWEIPQDVLVAFEKGINAGKMADMITRDLLEWYLPWHEQVYLPWYQSLQPPSEGQA